MANRKPLVLASGQFTELPVADSLSFSTSATYGGLSITQTGSTAARVTVTNASAALAYFNVYDPAIGFGLGGNGGFGADNSIVIMADQSVLNGGTHSVILRAGGYDSSQDRFTVSAAGIKINSGLSNYANDAAAAAGGVPVTGLYRNGSVVMIRVA